MKLFAVILILYLVSEAIAGKSTKKHKDDSAILTKKLINKSKPSSPPAIIAIEIVDPNKENKTKNSKRTIDSSLGYGYQPAPKYEVYKYSQHDIPPYMGSHNLYTHGIKSHNYDIQKSISYNLPSQTLHQYYQPGNTYYSTVNTDGEATGLSSHQPQEPHVPVIILKVYPSQLNDPGAVLRPNLPQTHPLASVVNSIDVQALLSKYAQHLNPTPNHYQPQLQTYENYPQDSHTRVIFHKDNRKPEIPETKTIQVHVPEGSYSSVQVETPEMQYGYVMPIQQYYYQNDNEQQQNYYYPSGQAEEYQQPQQDYQQPQQDYQPPQQDYQQQQQDSDSEDEHVMPYNYHAHQKRSRKAKYAKDRDDEGLNDVIRLDPIRA